MCDNHDVYSCFHDIHVWKGLTRAPGRARGWGGLKAMGMGGGKVGRSEAGREDTGVIR